jgi:[ribosomal protein S18]-alanine N-acetyltransferase
MAQARALRPERNDAVSVRLATLSDLDGIHALENASFQHDRLSRRAIRSFIAAPHGRLLVAKFGVVLAGYGVLVLRINSRVARLYSIAVDPRFGRRGVGRALMQGAEDLATERGCVVLRLEVRQENAAAIALYESHGYQPFGEYHDYYQDGASALRMEKRLVGDL